MSHLQREWNWHEIPSFWDMLLGHRTVPTTEAKQARVFTSLWAKPPLFPTVGLEEPGSQKHNKHERLASFNSNCLLLVWVFDSLTTEQELHQRSCLAWARPQDQWHVMHVLAFPATELRHVVKASQSPSVSVQFWATCLHLYSGTRTFTVAYFPCLLNVIPLS